MHFSLGLALRFVCKTRG